MQLNETCIGRSYRGTILYVGILRLQRDSKLRDECLAASFRSLQVSCSFHRMASERIPFIMYIVQGYRKENDHSSEKKSLSTKDLRVNL